MTAIDVDGLDRWHPEVEPVDNRRGTTVRPRWHLLLDDPSPRRALVVGTADRQTEEWLAERGTTTDRLDRATTGGDASAAGVDLIVWGDGAGRPPLGRLAGRLAPGGGVWLPGPRTRGRDRALAAAGFGSRRWLSGRHEPTPGVVAGVEGPVDRPPVWLARLGATVGWDGARGRWSSTTPTAYPSQKSIIRLRRPDGTSAVIVKATQHPRYNPRLVNEARALTVLAGADGRTPRVLATARPGGVVAVAEEALAGEPFLDASRLGPRDALADDAATALAELGRRTRRTATGADLAERLAPAVDAHVTRCEPPPDVAGHLRAQLEVLRRAPAVPLVLFHGDMGTWNAWADDGHVRLLDWEAAGRDGPPLWDVFHFARSYAIRTGRARGLTRVRAVDRHLVRGSRLTPVLAEWIARAGRSVGLDRSLVAPLFHLCWVHRAVKEAARLPADRPGIYGPLSTRLVTARDAPGLRRLLTG